MIRKRDIYTHKLCHPDQPVPIDIAWFQASLLLPFGLDDRCEFDSSKDQSAQAAFHARWGERGCTLSYTCDRAVLSILRGGGTLDASLPRLVNTTK